MEERDWGRFKTDGLVRDGDEGAQRREYNRCAKHGLYLLKDMSSYVSSYQRR